MSSGILVAFMLPLATALKLAQNGDPSVNILLFYEDFSALKSFDAAVDFINNTPSLKVKIGHVYEEMARGTYIDEVIESLCKRMDYITSDENSKPDIVVDLTEFGVASEAVKTIVKSMNLPTISGSYGREKEIRSWRELPNDAKNYLIQIAPPADILPYVVNSIVSFRNLSNAVLLFDTWDYGFHHNLVRKHVTKDLLQRSNFFYQETWISMRHFYSEKGFKNFFVFGNQNEISQSLGDASKKHDDGYSRPYTTRNNSFYSISMSSELPNCSQCRTNVSLIHLSPTLSRAANKRRDFLSSKGDGYRMSLNEMFYFDLVVDAILTVGKMKWEKTWNPPPNRACNDTDIIQDDYYLNLYDISIRKKFGEKIFSASFIWIRTGLWAKAMQNLK